MGCAHFNTLFDHFGSTEEHVGNTGNLTVGPKMTKQTYADILASTNAIHLQDEQISNCIDPLDGTKLISLN